MIIFAGPSLNAQSISLINDLGWIRYAPARRGDLRNCQERNAPGMLVIADGIFHQALSVGHEEIMDAIRAGWEVWGLCSMGAIRAYELRDFGMHGFGKVYARFFSMDDFQDDELALLHEAEFPYRSLTEPLVHYRVCVETLAGQGVISTHVAAEIISNMKSLYFGERTMQSFLDQLSPHVPDTRTILEQFDQYRVKQADLRDFLLQFKRSAHA